MISRSLNKSPIKYPPGPLPLAAFSRTLPKATGFNCPWGPNWRDGVANTSESGIGHTTPVGGGEERRVLRGGSWDGSQEFAAASCCNHSHPSGRFVSTGFRVVWWSPITAALRQDPHQPPQHVFAQHTCTWLIHPCMPASNSAKLI